MWPDWLGTHLKHSISDALLVQSASNAQGGAGDVARLVEYLESSIPRTTKLSTVAHAIIPTLRRWGQEDQEFTIMLGYSAS